MLLQDAKCLAFSGTMFVGEIQQKLTILCLKCHFINFLFCFYCIKSIQTFAIEADILSGIPWDGKLNRYKSRDWDGTGNNVVVWLVK